MSLRSDVKKTLADLTVLRTVETEGATTTDVIKVTQDLAVSLETFGPATLCAQVLAEAGLLPAEITPRLNELRTKVMTLLDKFEARVAETPTQPRRGRQFANLKASLDVGGADATQFVSSFWREQREEVVTIRVRLQQAASPEGPAAESLDELLDELGERKWTRPPTTLEAIWEHKDLLEKAKKLADGLKTIEVPEQVAKLLERAARGTGAHFHMMTPDVYDWLREHDSLGAELRIRRNA